MTTPGNPQEPYTPFLPSTFNVPEDEDRLRVFLVDKLSNFSDAINYKKIGLYMQAAETLNGEQHFYSVTTKTRSGYQTVAFVPSLPNNTTLTLTLTSVPTFPISNIGPQFVIKEVWGSASKPCSAQGAGDGRYFSFMAQGDTRISFVMTDISLAITTTTDLSAYIGLFYFEYIHDGV